MDTQTQIDRLIELAIIQRTELKQLVEQLPQLREHLNAEVERTFEEAEPQIRTELEEFVTRQAADKTATLGVALEAKIGELAKSLEESAQAKYSALIATRDQNATLLAQAEERIAAASAELPAKVKDIVAAELARFPRAGEIDQLRKEFAEPRGLNPRGKWQAGESYNKLDLVTINGDSYTSNTDNNITRPTRSSSDWTLVAARGAGGGGGPTSLSELTTVPSNGDILIGSGTSWVTSNLTAGAGISITVGAGEITISATDGDITLDDGTAASPSLHFTNDADTGLYRPADNTLGISVSGTQVAYFDTNGLTIPSAGVVAGGSFHGANGNANNPTFSFQSDQDTGMFRHGTNELGFTVGGTEKAVLTSTTFTVTPNLVVSGTGTINGTSIPASKTLVVTTDKLSALASTSSSELAGVISDETGTGALVFANTPTLVTPNIGAATGTSATLTGNVTASDLILGTSGPSAKSSINARAARQGLVFDGTSVATVGTISAFGTSDFSVLAIIVPKSSVGAQQTVFMSAVGGFYLAIKTDGTMGIAVSGAGFTVSSTGAVAFDKASLITYTRSGTTGTFYINGVLAGTASDSNNYSQPINQLNYSGVSQFFGLIDGISIYNRALSAAEVVSLFEAGVPAAADYAPQIAGTALLTGDSSTFTGGVGVWLGLNGGSIAASGGVGVISGMASVYDGAQTPNTSPSYLRKGYRYRLTVTTSAYVGGTYFAYGDGAGVTYGILYAGTSTVEFTAQNNTTFIFFRGGGGCTSVSIDNVTLVPLGLLLAPDAGQAGGGLTWYDTSGNAANITLPASGVAWSVPSSRYLGGNWTTSGNLTVSGGGVDTAASTSLTLSGGSSGANLVLGSGTNGAATVTSKGSGRTTFTTPRTNAFGQLFTNSGTVAANDRVGFLFGFNGIYANSGIAAQILDNGSTGAEDVVIYSGTNATGAGEVARFKNTGNLLIGTTTDGGQKLQVNGTAAIAGNFTSTARVTSYSGSSSYCFLDSGYAQIYKASSGTAYVRLTSGGAHDWDVSGGLTKWSVSVDGGSDLLSVDTSGNATFAGTINVNGTATSTVKGTIVSDVNTNTTPSFRSKDTINSGDSWRFGIGTTVDNQTFGFYDETTSTAVLSLGRTGNASLAGTIATQGGTASTPANAFATGTAGTIRWDASYIYVCTATNTWKRVAIATW